MNNTIIYLIRHGQSQGNLDYTQGVGLESTELGTPLTDEGVNQAFNLSQALKNIKMDGIYSSHLIRAKQTAEIIARQFNLPVLIKPEIRERERGNLNNLSELEIRKEHPVLYGNPEQLSEEEMWHYQLFPDMETASHAVERFLKALREIARSEKGKTVAIVSHGNVIRSFLVKIKYTTFEQIPQHSLANTGYIKLKTDGINFKVLKTEGLTIKKIIIN